MDWTKLLTALFGLSGVAAGAYFTYRAKRNEVVKTNEQTMIDQLQEAQEAQDARFKVLELKVDKLLARDVRSRQFIWQLIAHINKELGPPAPDWPLELL